MEKRTIIKKDLVNAALKWMAVAIKLSISIYYKVLKYYNTLLIKSIEVL